MNVGIIFPLNDFQIRIINIAVNRKKRFNVLASNYKMSGISIGDYLVVKILEGLTQSITKSNKNYFRILLV